VKQTVGSRREFRRVWDPLPHLRGRERKRAYEGEAVEPRDGGERERGQANPEKERNILYAARQLCFITQHQANVTVWVVGLYRDTRGASANVCYPGLPLPSLGPFRPISFAPFSQPARPTPLSCPPPCSRFNRETVFAPTIITQPGNSQSRDVKMKSYACVRERDVDAVSNGGRNCATGNTHGDWAMNAKRQREFITSRENWLLIN